MSTKFRTRVSWFTIQPAMPLGWYLNRKSPTAAGQRALLKLCEPGQNPHSHLCVSRLVLHMAPTSLWEQGLWGWWVGGLLWMELGGILEVLKLVNLAFKECLGLCLGDVRHLWAEARGHGLGLGQQWRRLTLATLSPAPQGRLARTRPGTRCTPWGPSLYEATQDTGSKGCFPRAKWLWAAKVGGPETIPLKGCPLLLGSVMQCADLREPCFWGKGEASPVRVDPWARMAQVNPTAAL